MSTIRKLVRLQATEVAPNRTHLIAATSQLARDGHVLEPTGMDVSSFLRVGTILFDHDPKIPVGVPVAAEINRAGDLEVEIEWAPEGVSAKADEIRGLVKAGILRAGSVGFDPIDTTPLDPSRPRGGQHITKSDLLELSIVSVPADTGAIVTQRSDKAEDWKCGASRDLPIEDSGDWDGPAAEASIFEWAGGDDFDPTKARKGFLAYNASKPKERGSYKLPIAHVVGGRLKVPKGAIRAAASRLPQADIPEECKNAAREVIDHYEEKAGMVKKDGDRGAQAIIARSARVPRFKRGLSGVAQLAWAVEQLGYLHECSEWEEDLEGDDSEVPAMLGAALKQLGDSLIAMTQEEVEELLEAKGLDDEADADGLDDADRSFIAAGKTASVRAWRRGIALARAGRVLSASNEKKLEKASDHHERALRHHKATGDSHKEAGASLASAQAAHAKAVKAHADAGDALQAAQADPQKAAAHVAAAEKHLQALGKHQNAVAEAHSSIGDAHEDAEDSHAATGRSVERAQRQVRAVIDGATPGSDDGDSEDVQTSGGTEDSAGSANGRSADFRRRQAELLSLAAE